MNIKRAFISITALLLLPVAAFAQITPAPNTANIAVSVAFSPVNANASVTLTLHCDTGTYNAAPVTLAAPLGGAPQHVFIIADIPGGVVNPCTVTQTAVAGYTTDATCSNQGPGDVSCVAGASSFCNYGDVNNEEVGLCALDNVVGPVIVAITKKWVYDDEAIGASDINTTATIALTCDAEIVGVTETGDSDHWTKVFNTSGNKTVTAQVIPESSTRPNRCFAVESNVDSAVEVTNGCGNMSVLVGSGASCTITNTVFFEGIPTLSQYGMAIMALLMLGVGFVGFRRFV